MFAMTPKQEDIAKRQRGLYLDTGLFEDEGDELAMTLRARLDEFDGLGGEMVRAYVRSVMGRILAGRGERPASDTASLSQRLGDVLAGRMMECVGRGDEHLFETYACLWHEWDEWRSHLAPGPIPVVSQAMERRNAVSASAMI